MKIMYSPVFILSVLRESSVFLVTGVQFLFAACQYDCFYYYSIHKIRLADMVLRVFSYGYRE